MYNCAQVALASKDVYKKMFWVQSLMDAAALIVASTNYHITYRYYLIPLYNSYSHKEY